MIWSKGGENRRSVVGGKIWVVGWLCGRGFYGYVFCKRYVAGVFCVNFSRAGKWV